MKLKTIHIVIDDKFIDGAISLFESDERLQNTYAIFGDNSNCKFVKSNRIVHLSSDSALSTINTYDVVVLHSLPAVPLEVIKKIKEGILVVWLAWGYDIYEPPYNIIPVDLYGTETKRCIKRGFIRDNLRKLNVKRNYNLRRALERIDYFSGVFPYEIDLIKASHTYFKANPIDFYYGSTNFFIPENPSVVIRTGKRNVIIGNSADPSNNHLDVLKIISDRFLSFEGNMILPLSYGGTPDYINSVERTARQIAGDRVISLKSFLSLDEYLNLISNCKIAVFAHERQQASDNIFLQIMYGARVYMSETSASYNYLKGLGLKVFSIQSDMKYFDTEMDEEDVMENRKILSSLYSSTKLIKRVKTIVDILLEGKG